MIEYNGNSNSNFDHNVEFIDIDLFCNKLNIQVLPHDFIPCIKKRRKLETEDEANKLLKVKATWKKKYLLSQLAKKV